MMVDVLDAMFPCKSTSISHEYAATVPSCYGQSFDSSELLAVEAQDSMPCNRESHGHVAGTAMVYKSLHKELTAQCPCPTKPNLQSYRPFTVNDQHAALCTYAAMYIQAIPIGTWRAERLHRNSLLCHLHEDNLGLLAAPMWTAAEPKYKALLSKFH